MLRAYILIFTLVWETNITIMSYWVGIAVKGKQQKVWYRGRLPLWGADGDLVMKHRSQRSKFLSCVPIKSREGTEWLQQKKPREGISARLGNEKGSHCFQSDRACEEPGLCTGPDEKP